VDSFEGEQSTSRILRRAQTFTPVSPLVEVLVKPRASGRARHAARRGGVRQLPDLVGHDGEAAA
jgi:hypothetical protein